MTACILCGLENHTQLLSLPCGNLDGSFLYDSVRILCCENCGHIFNDLTDTDKNGLLRYYQEEYSICNLQSPNKDGDTPGSSGQNSRVRYRVLYDFISPCLTKNMRILDIGCALAGFLRFMKEQGHANLYGVDSSLPYISEVADSTGIAVALGTAENTGMDAALFDFIVADQVVEHLFDPNKIFIEAKRILKKGGYLCISVPNAAFYLENYFFDFYWFLMREHIHHFDEAHLIALGNRHGFSVKTLRNTLSPFITKHTSLPNLSIIFTYTGEDSDPHTSFNRVLEMRVRAYISNCYSGLKRRQDFISSIGRTPFYVWGIGREFLYLDKNTSLTACGAVAGLLDDIPEKQRHTVGGMPILPSKTILGKSDSRVLITAYAHKEAMQTSFRQEGYRGTFL